MNVVGPAAAAAAAAKLLQAPDSTTAAAAAAATVNLYLDSPNYELSLDDFELYALKRLSVLRKMEQLKLMRVPPDQMRQKVDHILKEQDLTNPTIDQASHFILRLSYCQTEELRRWFLMYECALFRHRLSKLTQAQLAHSVKNYAHMEPISAHQKKRLAEQLQAIHLTPAEFAATAFYAVPFQHVLELLATRKCFVQAGMAYVPQDKVVTILVNTFRTHLSRRLARLASVGLESLQDAESARIYPLLRNLDQVLVNADPHHDHSLQQSDGNTTTGLTAQNVATFAPHMPLCTRQLQTGLLKDGHLKNFGRFQYGIFLKSAGLPLADALQFFQKHFTKITGEQFQKQYAYNIRHQYGQEGKPKRNYTWSCSKIIHGPAPNAADHHGCPYRHYDAEHLQSLLQQLHIGTASSRRDIMQLKEAGQFQLACLQHFQVQHPGVLESSSSSKVSMEGIGNHPNAWFRASVAYRDGTTMGSPPNHQLAVVDSAMSRAADRAPTISP